MLTLRHHSLKAVDIQQIMRTAKGKTKDICIYLYPPATNRSYLTSILIILEMKSDFLPLVLQSTFFLRAAKYLCN